MDKIVVKKSKLLDVYIDGLISRVEFEKTNNQYNKQLDAFNKQLEVLKLDNKIAEDLQQKLANIEKTIETIVKLKEFSESVCGEILHKVVIEGRDKLSFYLMSGETAEPAFFKVSPLVTQSLFYQMQLMQNEKH